MQVDPLGNHVGADQHSVGRFAEAAQRPANGRAAPQPVSYRFRDLERDAVIRLGWGARDMRRRRPPLAGDAGLKTGVRFEHPRLRFP